MCLCTIKWIIIWKKKPSVFFGLYGREMLLVTLNTELTAIHTEHVSEGLDTHFLKVQLL